MLTNNDILKKLRIAYTLKLDDVAAMLRGEGVKVSDSEVTAFFRPEADPKRRYRAVADGVLVAFLQALLQSGMVSAEEGGTIRQMMELKAIGKAVPAERKDWLDALIERKRV